MKNAYLEKLEKESAAEVHEFIESKTESMLGKSVCSFELGTKSFYDAMRTDYEKLAKEMSTPYSGKVRYSCPLCRDTGFTWEVEDYNGIPQMNPVWCRRCNKLKEARERNGMR